MSQKDLKRSSGSPSDNDEIWWYEENGGLGVYLNVPYLADGTVKFTIPVATIRAYLKRKDK